MALSLKKRSSDNCAGVHARPKCTKAILKYRYRDPLTTHLELLVVVNHPALWLRQLSMRAVVYPCHAVCVPFWRPFLQQLPQPSSQHAKSAQHGNKKVRMTKPVRKTQVGIGRFVLVWPLRCIANTIGSAWHVGRPFLLLSPCRPIVIDELDVVNTRTMCFPMQQAFTGRHRQVWCRIDELINIDERHPSARREKINKRNLSPVVHTDYTSPTSNTNRKHDNYKDRRSEAVRQCERAD